MWLAIDLSLVFVGIVLIALAALSAWRRWKRMLRAGGRFGDRVTKVGELAGSLADQLQATERLPERTL